MAALAAVWSIDGVGMPLARPRAWIDSRAFCSVLVNFTKRGILRRESLAGRGDAREFVPAGTAGAVRSGGVLLGAA
jgi:hypothetical protein